ncbi:BatD family protein [Cyclonatronum proteinivorum]|nr:BatD family protein [Cyclonatronum proteinivorum]
MKTTALPTPAANTRVLTFFLVFIALLCFTAADGFAKQAEPQARLTATSERAFVGERIIVAVEISGRRIENVQRPELQPVEGLRIISATPTRTSAFDFRDGQQISTVGFRFTIEAVREGEHTIPAVRLIMNGRTYTTNPLTIEVLGRDQLHQEDVDDNIFVRLEVSNERPFRGEQVQAKVVLYFHQDISVISYQPSSTWRTEGFWLERLTEEEGPRAQNVTVRGQPFRRAELMSYSLFPTRSGEVSIGGYNVTVNMRPVSRFGDASRFVESFGRSQRSVRLRTQTVDLQVRPLPQPQPEGFSGAVGQFTVSRAVPETEIRIGEPLNIETTFTGQGNISLVDHPGFSLPEGFDVFQPRENLSINKTTEGVRGTKSFTDVLVARETGRFEVPAATVSWFDPRTRRYRSQPLTAVPVRVLYDPGAETSVAGVHQLNVNLWTGSVTWYTQTSPGILLRNILILIFLLLPVGLLMYAWTEKRKQDEALLTPENIRASKALTTATALLRQADAFAENDAPKEAYKTLNKAVSDYAVHKLKLPEGSYPDSQILAALNSRLTGKHMIYNRLRWIFTRNSEMTFGTDTSLKSYQYDRAECEAILNELEELFD